MKTLFKTLLIAFAIITTATTFAVAQRGKGFPVPGKDSISTYAPRHMQHGRMAQGCPCAQMAPAMHSPSFQRGGRPFHEGMPATEGEFRGRPGMGHREFIPDLTDQQKKDIQALREKQMEEIQKIRQEVSGKIQTLREEHHKKFLELLTPEQKKALETGAAPVPPQAPAQPGKKS